MTSHRFQAALLPQGWAHDLEIEVSAQGVISRVSSPSAGPASVADAAHERGIAVPGMTNAHSHAFQRAMIGDTEFRRSARDSFWTWRQAMYGLANRVTPEDLALIATQLFIEMLKSGYTSVAEFHYLHRRQDGAGYGDAENPLHGAIIAAARRTGIGLTLLPTLYQHSDFGGKPLREDQRRFHLTIDEFIESIRFQSQTAQPGGTIRCGAAFHSLRAVSLGAMREAIAELDRIDPHMPLHIHVSEQMIEVNACRRLTGKRPVELLLHENLLNARWCLVHATHTNRDELRGIVDAGATVCVCPTTEGNLGDGCFDAEHFLDLGGRLAIGSDSQASICPAEELRWFEYQQRLRRRRRAVLASPAQQHVGTRLWEDAASGGARALGQPCGELKVGARADWLVLDPQHPSMAGSPPANHLDRLVFTCAREAIREVVVSGRCVIDNRRHALEAGSASDFSRWMQQRLLETPPAA
jgi:formimidoylglutamate deiminase